MSPENLRRAIRAAADHAILEPRQIMALLSVHQRSGISTGDIARECAISKPAATRAIQALCRIDLLTSVPDPNDRRRVCLTLTKSGQDAVAGILKAAAA